jgi:hypothetical protein
MNSSELDLYSNWTNMTLVWEIRKVCKYELYSCNESKEIFLKHGCFWIECQTSAASKLSSNLIRGVEWHFLLKVNYDIVIFLTRVDDNNIIIVFMSLRLKVCISDKFCIKVINFQREDKDQDALLVKESLSSVSEK